MQKTRESYFLVPLLKARQHLLSGTLVGLVFSLRAKALPEVLVWFKHHWYQNV